MVAESRPLRADARRNRDRLLQAARDAFAAEGLSVSLDEIARRAGVGPGTLYRHFPTKEALFEAVVHERLDPLLAEARALRRADDAGAALFAFVERLVTDAATKADLIDAIASAGAELQTTVATTTAGLWEEIGHLLARAQASGAIRDDIDIADLTAVLSGVLLALRHHANQGANPHRTLAILRDGLRPRPATA
ncbi:helix-turn-helix transcriptional regulator [Frankia sp. CNm7]|uniref:Helix-turn-helix transcriptional regulator n=1 Tax=Frankia nepalensis TaxID=1836974 RepID=A0A937ULC8_9ACTN|nr:TetR/AcrR family transcriptional regulator [Frankia nepalensis]MBL7500351.1 helix-turn-helix transcriptional regulator [Frankia nepalensis]MBL7508573.1 helix-turn-helix transcriptional regulator [Frankia nepalensis]MBL7517793.1 helix-turn-helix transcriptional regulator [Frankia nepalensis]MBL7627704.1 helix-turn-helix transcriptional regulator [Frankia nepalensis]